jgi:hypothetical protein
MSDEFMQEVDSAIEENDPEELLGVIIDVSLAAEDAMWAQVCFARLAQHENVDVRGNAMIGFAHLAKRFGELDQEIVEPILEAGLKDEKEYVREQAEAALSELRGELGWRVVGA